MYMFLYRIMCTKHFPSNNQSPLLRTSKSLALNLSLSLSLCGNQSICSREKARRTCSERELEGSSQDLRSRLSHLVISLSRSIHRRPWWRTQPVRYFVSENQGFGLGHFQKGLLVGLQGAVWICILFHFGFGFSGRSGGHVGAFRIGDWGLVPGKWRLINSR